VSPRRSKTKSGFEISWTTVSYRSVAVVLIAIAGLTYIVMRVAAPKTVQMTTEHVETAAQWLGSKIGVAEPPTRKTLVAGPQQAHFTAIDGTVRVKKASANSWVNADYNLPLERGDVVQTGAEGLARVIFADGASYTVKQDSLIVVDDNSVNTAQQTQVSVQVTNGTVDLTTATFSQGSRSQVVVDGATASFAPDTSAQVKNAADTHEIVVRKGSGEVSRGGQSMHLNELERVTFEPRGQGMSKRKELGPPGLVAPANMDTIYAVGSRAQVRLNWRNSGAGGARVKVSRNPYFTSLVQDAKTRGDSLTLALPPGDYYWSAQALDASGHASMESDRNRFTVLPGGESNVKIELSLQPPLVHGHYVEVRGKSTPGASIYVNGQEAPMAGANGDFAFLTPSLHSGEAVITVTARDAKGGVNTKQLRVAIE